MLGTVFDDDRCSLFVIHDDELSSSIGMAKAALEAMNGFNLYGDKGANWSVVYVDVVKTSINQSINQ
jgi:hypothetical protein